MKNFFKILFLSAATSIFFSPLHGLPKPIIQDMLNRHAAEIRRKKHVPTYIEAAQVTIENITRLPFTLEYKSPASHQKGHLVRKTITPGQTVICTLAATKFLSKITIQHTTAPTLHHLIYPRTNGELYTIISADAKYFEVQNHQQQHVHMIELE